MPIYTPVPCGGDEVVDWLWGKSPDVVVSFLSWKWKAQMNNGEVKVETKQVVVRPVMSQVVENSR